MIRELAAGGDGVGRAADGRVVFVPFTTPGDRVRVKLSSSRPRYARGTVEQLLASGPDRVDPVCAVFGSCGGCAWQHVSYAAQLEAKRHIVAAALERIGGMQTPALPPVVPSPSEYRYRSRSRVLVAGGRVGYRRRRSHALCATARCPILVESIDERLAELSESPPERDGEWELSHGFADGSDVPVTRAVSLPAHTGPSLSLPVGEDRVVFSPGVFVQANAGLLEGLVSSVVDAAGEGELVFDLFAGAGFLTLGLARRFVSVVALEANAAAAGDLEANLQRAGLANTRVIAESLESAVSLGRFDGVRPNVVVLDPPRTGLPDGSAEWLAELRAERIVYLSCDPATLARDASVLHHRGYELASVRAFDLFPQTPHVEVLAVLDR